MNRDDEVKKFNKFFNDKYEHLLNYCDRYDYPQDLLHHAYEKTLNKIKKSGWEGSNNYYTTYIINTIVNTYINEKKHSYNKKTDFIIDNEDYYCDVVDSIDVSEEMYIQNQYIVSKLFKYIQYKLQATEEEVMIFKLYYLSNEKMTYKKINKLTGINKNRITRILKKIKTELNNNFINYLREEDDVK